ncbi:MAG: fimbrillin family protein, partial [Alistipes sp.]|nr:fimbrillin family protein [Alistipes sp.]
MSMMKKYISIAVILLLAASCDKEHDFAQENPNEITVEASMGGARATLTNFEPGDQMSLYAVEYIDGKVAEVQPAGNFLNNELMTYNGTKWNAGRTLYWSENPCDFYGFYPYQPTASMSDILYEVAADQSKPSADGVLGGYEQSDLMWAKASNVTRNDGAVHLQFRHMMTRVVVDIVRGPKFEGELPEDISVHIYNTATSAFVDWRIGSVEVNHQGGHKTINMRQ